MGKVNSASHCGGGKQRSATVKRKKSAVHRTAPPRIVYARVVQSLRILVQCHQPGWDDHTYYDSVVIGIQCYNIPPLASEKVRLRKEE